jgi:hypothetical protein
MIIRIAALYCNASLCTVLCTVTALYSQAFRLGEVTVNRVGIRLLMLLVLPKKVVRLPRDWAEASHLVLVRKNEKRRSFLSAAAL